MGAFSMKAMAYPFRVFIAMALAAAFLTSAAWGWSPSQPTVHPQKMLLVVEKDNGTTISIHRDQLLQITLPENATTGYRWAVDHYDQALIEPMGSTSHYTGAAVGSGGMVDFMFGFKTVGTGSLGLKLWRHWEGDSSISNRFSIRVNVQP